MQTVGIIKYNLIIKTVSSKIYMERIYEQSRVLSDINKIFLKTIIGIHFAIKVRECIIVQESKE